MNETEYQEKDSYQMYKEETWKTKIFKLFFYIVVGFAVIYGLSWIFGDYALFGGVRGLGIWNRYVRYLDLAVLFLITGLFIPPMWIILEKFKLFIQGHILDFSNLPIVDKIRSTSKKIDSSLFYDGQPLEIRYKDNKLSSSHVEFAVCLGQTELVNNMDRIVKENIEYSLFMENYGLMAKEDYMQRKGKMSLSKFRKNIIEKKLEAGESIELSEAIELETKDSE